MIKNYNYKTNYIAYYVVKYTKNDVKSSVSGFKLNFLTREKNKLHRYNWDRGQIEHNEKLDTGRGGLNAKSNNRLLQLAPREATEGF